MNHLRRGLFGISCVATLNISPFHVLADNNNDISPIRVAIIGSGVGGASTAYFLRELLTKHNINRDITMDMYEKNDYVGGRVRGVNLESYCGGQYTKDIGATIIIKQNRYMFDFGKNILNLDLKMEGVDDNDHLGLAFFDEPRGKLSPVWDERWGSLKLIKRWGFLHFITLMYNARDFVKKFGQIYDFQKDEKTFDNAIDLWDALGLKDSLYGNGMQYINKEINKFVPSFLKKPIIINPIKNQSAPAALQLVTALTRNNYTQEPQDLPPIVTAAAVSTLAANGLCYIANGGNSLIEKGLIEVSNTDLKLNYEIVSIDKNETDKYILNNDIELEYDYVIIAAPLTLTNIKFNVDNNYESDCNKQIDLLSKQEYVDVHKHYLKGKLNPKYFGFYDNDPKHLEKVGTIFSSNLGALSNPNKKTAIEKTLPCTTIARDCDSQWVRFMGKQKFTDDILNEIMEEWDKDSLQRFYFKAYPKFKWNRDNIDCLPTNEQKKILRFCMDKNKLNGGLYYLNVLECGMSAQEIMAVAGKNVALLVFKQILASQN
eukprot:184869_1